MEGYMPSEVARMVLGYLKETHCVKTREAFLLESHHLKEYAECLRQGKEYPTNIAGKSLSQILQDYCILTHIDWDCKTDKDQLISTLDKALSQVKHLMSSNQQNSKEARPNILGLGGRRQQSLVRQHARRKLLLAKRNAGRISEEAVGCGDMLRGTESRVSRQSNLQNNRPTGVADQISSSEENVPVYNDRRFAQCLNNKYVNTQEKRRTLEDVEKNLSRSDPRIHSHSLPNVNSFQLDSRAPYCNEAEIRNPARTAFHVTEDVSPDNSPERLRSDERISNSEFQSPEANPANSIRSVNKPVRNLETIFRTPSSPNVTRSSRSAGQHPNSGNQKQNFQSQNGLLQMSAAPRDQVHSPVRNDVVHQSARNDNFQIPPTPSLQRRMNQNARATDSTNGSRPRIQNPDNIFQPPVITYSDENFSCQPSPQPQPRTHTTLAENYSRSEDVFQPQTNHLHQSPTANSRPPSTANSSFEVITSHSGPQQQRPRADERAHNMKPDTNRPSNRTLRGDTRGASNGDLVKASTVPYHRIHPTTLTDVPNYSRSNSGSVNNEVFHPPEMAINENSSKSLALQEQRAQSAANCGTSIGSNKQNEICLNKQSTGVVNTSNFSASVERETRVDSGQHESAAANPSNKTSHEILHDKNFGNSSAPYKRTCIEKAIAQEVNFIAKTLDLTSPENMTPLNSVEPDLPSRFPEDCDSPRYILSQQRSAVASLTTPVKDQNDQSFYSPRRKSHIPRRRLIPTSSPLASQQQQEAEPIFEELINFPPLLERIAENINKAVSSDHQEPSELDATISPTTMHIPDAVIKDILFRTETDPLFEEVLSLLCEKYDSSRDSGDGNQNTEGIDEAAQKDFRTQQIEIEVLSTPKFHVDQDAPEDSSPDPPNEENENCNDTVVVIEAPTSGQLYTSGSEATQVAVSANSEIILTNDNLLALKNGAEIYVTTSSGTAGTRPMEMVNAVISNEADFGTCIQVLDKPIMSTMNPQANGTFLMNAAALTPVKITIPDFQFLTLSPSQLFGMNTYILESKKSPEKKGQPLLLPKPDFFGQGFPIRRNQTRTLVSARHRPTGNVNQKKPVRTVNNTKEKIIVSRPSTAVTYSNNNIFSSKSRASRTHVRTLDFGSHVPNEVPIETKSQAIREVQKDAQSKARVKVQPSKEPHVVTVAKAQTKKLMPPAASTNVAQTSRLKKVLPKPDTVVVSESRRSSSCREKREDADQVVAATLVSMANSTHNPQGSRSTKSDHKKKRKSDYDEHVPVKNKKKNQDKLLKGMDVDKFLSKIHAVK